jgi:adenosylhomocysteine nucleosidase
MMFPDSVEVVTTQSDPDTYEKTFWFPVDSEMLEVARRVSAKVKLTNCTTDNVCLQSTPIVAVGGNGVSGSTFVDNAQYRNYSWHTFQADALDMETAAIAHVAKVYDIPYIAFRSLSDLAGGGPGEN